MIFSGLAPIKFSKHDTSLGLFTDVAGVLLCRNVKQFRGRLLFKAHRLVYHSILGLRVIEKKKQWLAFGRLKCRHGVLFLHVLTVWLELLARRKQRKCVDNAGTKLSLFGHCLVISSR